MESRRSHLYSCTSADPGAQVQCFLATPTENNGYNQRVDRSSNHRPAAASSVRCCLIKLQSLSPVSTSNREARWRSQEWVCGTSQAVHRNAIEKAAAFLFPGLNQNSFNQNSLHSAMGLLWTPLCFSIPKRRAYHA